MIKKLPVNIHKQIMNYVCVIASLGQEPPLAATDTIK